MDFFGITLFTTSSSSEVKFCASLNFESRPQTHLRLGQGAGVCEGVMTLGGDGNLLRIA
jgi:hypothetical protein